MSLWSWVIINQIAELWDLYKGEFIFRAEDTWIDHIEVGKDSPLVVQELIFY